MATSDSTVAELAEIEKKASILKNSFKNTNADLPKFDYVFMDCPPALNMLTVNALVLSNFIIIPLQTEFFALEGLTQLMKTIERIKNKKTRNLFNISNIFDFFCYVLNLPMNFEI